LKPENRYEEIHTQNDHPAQILEVSWDATRSFDLPKEQLMRQLLIADRSISLNSSESSSESSESMEGTSLEESMHPQSSTSVESRQRDRTSNDTTFGEERSSISLKLRQGRVKITSRNFQLVLKVLSAVKSKNVLPHVYKFMAKIIDNVRDIEFEVISESHREKIKHLFYFKLFKYVGFALKDLQENQEIFENDTISLISSKFNSYIDETVNENVSHVLENPRIYSGSVGYVAGLS
jgi:hypothetical protein